MKEYKAYQDADASDPRGNWEYLKGPQIIVYASGAFHGGLDDVDKSNPGAYAFTWYRASGKGDERSLALAQRYLRVFHKSADVLSLHSVEGYSQGDWQEVLVIATPEVADYVKPYVEEYEMYFRGDVYVVNEYEVDTCNLGHPHQTLVASVSEIYAESEEKAIAYYVEDHIPGYGKENPLDTVAKQE